MGIYDNNQFYPQNFNGYNNYPYNSLMNGQRNFNNNQIQAPNNNQLPRFKTTKVNGRAGAEMFQMGPDSDIVLIDETCNKIWYAQTDGAGYKTLIPYRITPDVEEQPVDFNDLANRLTNIEQQLSVLGAGMEELKNGKSNFRSTERKQSKPSAAKSQQSE